MDRMDIEKELIEDVCNDLYRKFFNEIKFDEKTKSLLMKYTILENSSNSSNGYYEFKKTYSIDQFNSNAFYYNEETTREEIIREAVLYNNLTYQLVKLVNDLRNEIEEIQR